MKTKEPPTRKNVARWIRRLTHAHNFGRIALVNKNGVEIEYDVGFHFDAEGYVTGLRLVKDDDEAHDIAITQWGWTCDCRDAQFRNHECKHVKGLRAALKAIGEEPRIKKQTPPAA